MAVFNEYVWKVHTGQTGEKNPFSTKTDTCGRVRTLESRRWRIRITVWVSAANEWDLNFKLITNRWAWELVPKRLAGCQMPSCKGGIHGNPGTREPPNQNPSLGAWRKEEPRTGVTWYLRSPTCPQAPVTENHSKTTTYLHRLTRPSPRPRNKML